MLGRKRKLNIDEQISKPSLNTIFNFDNFDNSGRFFGVMIIIFI